MIPAGGFVVAIHALKKMAVDDLIWTRHNGVYYLCRVLSTWKYDCDAAPTSTKMSSTTWMWSSTKSVRSKWFREKS